MWKRILTAVLAIALLALVIGQSRKPHGRTERYYAEEVRPVADQKIWVSTTGDMNAAASYSPSGVPGNTDSLAFVGKAGGGSDVSATINVAALNGVQLVEVHTMPTYPGDIGTVGAAAQIGNNATTVMIHQGTGTLHYGGDVQFLVIDSANTVLAAHVSVAVTLGLAVRGGHVTYASGVACSGLTITTWRDRPSSVEFLGTSGNFTSLRMSGGLVYSGRPQTSANSPFIINGGTFVQQRDGGALASVYIGSGTLVYNTTSTLANISIFGGVVDFSQDRRAKTVTALRIHPGGDYIDSNNLTISAIYDYRGVVPIIEP